MTGRLAERVAIVTGGGHGIRKAYALGLAKEGAAVVIAEIDGKGADTVAAELARQGFKALAIRTDVKNQQSVDESRQGRNLRELRGARQHAGRGEPG